MQTEIVRASAPALNRNDPAFKARRKKRADRIREHVRKFMVDRGLNPRSWAKLAGMPTPNILYMFLAGTTELLSPASLEALARGAGVSVAVLTGEEKEKPKQEPQGRPLPYMMDVCAGQYMTREQRERREFKMVDLPLPAAVKADQVVRLLDRHAEEIYPPGSFLAIRNLKTLGRPLRFGDRVLVVRSTPGVPRHGNLQEMTIREIVPDPEGTGAKLVFRSDEEGLPDMPMPWPYEGGNFGPYISHHAILGRVVMASFLEDYDAK